MAIIEELFHDQKLNIIEDQLRNARLKLVEMSGQAEFNKLQINLQQTELGKLEAAIALAATNINVISAQVKLIRAEAEAREVAGQMKGF